MSLDENKATARRYFEEGWNRHDFAVFEALFDPQSVHHLQTTAQRGPAGLAGFKERVGALFQAFPDYRCEIEDVIAEGDRVVVRYLARGTHTGTYLGAAPTGKPFVYRGVETHRYANGKIVERWNSHDTLGFYQQLGLMPLLPDPPPPQG
jgi:steroid delta-isomerase-like uncharacterized protein